MIGGNLYHAVIILGAQIHKVIVDGIDHLPFNVNFIMQVGAGTLSSATHSGNNLATHYLFPEFRPVFL